MNQPDPAKKVLISYCDSIFSLLNLYYNFSALPKIDDFILSPNDKLGKNSQVILEETNDDVFLGVHFTKDIYTRLLLGHLLSAHDLCILAEELSHFKFIADLLLHKSHSDIVTLETLGEIDRFLCIMHWNTIADHSFQKMPVQWKNIHDICDFVFTGNRFQGENKELYIEAENRAFKHLKEAFGHEWDSSHMNFATVSRPAKKYLSELRIKFLA